MYFVDTAMLSCSIGFARFVLIFAAMVLLAATPTRAQSAGLNALSRDVARLYQAGKYDDAVLVAERALALAEKTFGPENPEVGVTLNNLALLFRRQGRYAEAEPLYRRSLAITKTLGSDRRGMPRSIPCWATCAMPSVLVSAMRRGF